MTIAPISAALAALSLVVSFSLAAAATAHAENHDSHNHAGDAQLAQQETKRSITQIADIQGIWVPYTINRRNLERTVTVSATHLHLKADQLVTELMPALETLDLPPGYRWEMGGELEDAAIAQGHLFANFPIAGFFIVALHRAGLCTLTHTPSPMGFLGELLQRPKNEKAYVLLPVGYPAADCRVPDIDKKPLEEILIRAEEE